MYDALSSCNLRELKNTYSASTHIVSHHTQLLEYTQKSNNKCSPLSSQEQIIKKCSRYSSSLLHGEERESETVAKVHLHVVRSQFVSSLLARELSTELRKKGLPKKGAVKEIYVRCTLSQRLCTYSP